MLVSLKHRAYIISPWVDFFRLCGTLLRFKYKGIRGYLIFRILCSKFILNIFLKRYGWYPVWLNWAIPNKNIFCPLYVPSRASYAVNQSQTNLIPAVQWHFSLKSKHSDPWSWCYKTFFGGNLENLDFPSSQKSKNRPF